MQAAAANLKVPGKTPENSPSADRCQISAHRCHGIVWHRRASAPGCWLPIVFERMSLGFACSHGLTINMKP